MNNFRISIMCFMKANIIIHIIIYELTCIRVKIFFLWFIITGKYHKYINLMLSSSKTLQLNNMQSKYRYISEQRKRTRNVLRANIN